MNEKLKALSSALISPLVALLIIGTVGAIAGLLGFSTNKRSVAICVGVGLLGFVAVFYLVRSLYTTFVLTSELTEALLEGQQLIARGTDMMLDNRMEVEGNRQRWCEHVEQVLSRKSGGLASRFHVAGHQVHEREYGIEKMRPRIQVLSDIIKELEQSGS